MTDSEAVQRPAAPEQVSYWEDFVDILYAPSEVYARRAHGNFWIPLLAVTVFFALLWYTSTQVLQPVFDAEWDRQVLRTIESNPRMTPEMVEASRPMVQAVQAGAAIIFVPATIFLVAFTLWLVGKLFEAQQTFRAALVVTAYAYLPRVLEQAVAMMEGLFRDLSGVDGRNRLMWGVARFLDPDAVEPEVLAVVMRIDVFTIWVTVLLAIGLSVTGQISRRQAAIAGIMMWLLGAIPTYLAALAA